MTGLRVRLAGQVGGFRIEAGFDAPAGKVTTLFGPSGSGKTSALRAVAGLTRLAGSVEAPDGVWQDATRFRRTHRRRLGFVFQHPTLFAHLSVEANLRYAARRSGTAAADFGEIVERLGLEEKLPRRPAGLSGGERQRVALARALLARPRVLLLDEPFSALDLPARGALLPWLRARIAERAIATLHVTHDLDEVGALADRMALLRKGRVVASGPVEEVALTLEAATPRERFEAGAALPARLTGWNRETGIADFDIGGGARLRVPSPARPASEVRLRVRARDVALALERPRRISIRNIVEGRVLAIRDAGGALAEARVRVGDATIRAHLTREAVAELGLRPGVPVFALLKGVSLEAPS